MKPYIICHMMQSVDGRIACDMVDKISGDEYYTALDALECTAFIEGKHSYQIHYCGFDEFEPENPGPIENESVYVAEKTDNYQVSLDTKGSLLWDKCDNAGRLCIVSQTASTEYLSYLKSLGISFIATGVDGIDLDRAMEILHDSFGVKRVAVVGGGKINGGFLEAGLVDELSAMIAPGIDGRIGQPALFDFHNTEERYLPVKLELKSVNKLDNGVIWARYSVNKK